MRTSILCWGVMALLLAACTAGTQRGIRGEACISTARPAISLAARHLPFLAGGQGSINLRDADLPAGAPARVWLAAYGEGRPDRPMALVALAEVLPGWYWDGDARKPFCVDESVEVFNDVAYQAGTYLVSSRRDPFAALAGVEEGAPAVRWVARSFAARFNFDEAKVILEYREPAPRDLDGQEHLIIGQTDWLRGFEQRAREAFAVGGATRQGGAVLDAAVPAVRWRYMDGRFLGTVSKREPIMQ